MTRKTPTPHLSPCPCGAGLSYQRCCAPYIEGEEAAATAEALMRSRYCAYALGADHYVLATWHPSTRPATLDPAPGIKWTGLSIIHAEPGESEASVEFVARFKHNGRAQRLHEVSRFRRQDGRWYYVDGDVD